MVMEDMTAGYEVTVDLLEDWIVRRQRCGHYGASWRRELCRDTRDDSSLVVVFVERETGC